MKWILFEMYLVINALDLIMWENKMIVKDAYLHMGCFFCENSSGLRDRLGLITKNDSGSNKNK